MCNHAGTEEVDETGGTILTLSLMHCVYGAMTPLEVHGERRWMSEGRNPALLWMRPSNRQVFLNLPSISCLLKAGPQRRRSRKVKLGQRLILPFVFFGPFLITTVIYKIIYKFRR